MMDFKVPCLILTIISPVLLYEAPHFRSPHPLYPHPHPHPQQNRRNSVGEGLIPYYSYGPHGSPYRYENPAHPQFNRPVRDTAAPPAQGAMPKSDQVPAASGLYSSKRSQRAPSPKYAKFTLDDASAGYLNLPHGFQNPIKPAGFQPGNLFTAFKYGPAAAHVPLNALAGSVYYGQGHNANRGPVIYPDSQTEKPIEEPLQEAPVSPTPVAELTKAAVLHQHMFSTPSTAKPTVQIAADQQNVEYEIKYVPVYVDQESGKEVKYDELSNYRLKHQVESTPAFVAPPTQAVYKYVPAPSPATSYKYENQKYESEKYESSEKDYPHYAPRYEFGYRVHDSYTGSDFGQSEHRDGEVTKGSYHVLLPDGRHQTVNYWSDESGFHAKVKYDGVAKHYPAPTKASYDHAVDSNTIHT